MFHRPSHPPLGSAHPRNGVTRRCAIQAGAVGLLGLGFPHLAALKALAGPTAVPPVTRAKSVIYIFLSGGLAQQESFDMKPEASEEIRGEFRPIATRTAAFRFANTCPNLRCARPNGRWYVR